MKTINTLLRFIILLFLLTAINFLSCKKENSASLSPQQQTSYATTAAQADINAGIVFDDVFDDVMGVNTTVGFGGTGVFGNSFNASYSSGIGVNSVTNLTSLFCFAVTINPASQTSFFPVQIIINFGDSCTCSDGRTRKGKIITEYTGRLINPGSMATTTFDGYYINDLLVEGTNIIQNISTPGSRSFHVQVLNAKLTPPNGNYIQWNRDITISQIAGLSTPFLPLDDVFRIKGQANGATLNDSAYYQWSNVITDSLIKEFLCHWIVQGTVQINRGSQEAALINYGTGACDNKATITINGKVYNITLH